VGGAKDMQFARFRCKGRLRSRITRYPSLENPAPASVDERERLRMLGQVHFKASCQRKELRGTCGRAHIRHTNLRGWQRKKEKIKVQPLVCN
jgi:hypothetical protein